MANTEYYQIAHKQKFIDSGILEEDLSTCRVITQQSTVYPNMRCCGDFTVEPGMLIRHLVFANGFMQDMWAKAVMAQDYALIPFKLEEVNLILSNEPQEG